MQPFSADTNPFAVRFTTVPLWMTFGGLCLEHHIPAIIEFISSAAGECLLVFPKELSSRSTEGFRARVVVKVNEPLIQGTPSMCPLPTAEQQDNILQLEFLIWETGNDNFKPLEGADHAVVPPNTPEDSKMIATGTMTLIEHDTLSVQSRNKGNPIICVNYEVGSGSSSSTNKNFCQSLLYKNVLAKLGHIASSVDSKGYGSTEELGHEQGNHTDMNSNMILSSNQIHMGWAEQTTPMQTQSPIVLLDDIEDNTKTGIRNRSRIIICEPTELQTTARRRRRPTDAVNKRKAKIPFQMEAEFQLNKKRKSDVMENFLYSLP
ncbi:hypothetical protein FRX31_026007 [Thalictrum thalictroides]|uniref:DUF4283 domain-containing protein n=1 Tax=Thalictrum thalictroides TaxID=46969 RepID=A0A7J6VH23_THATH|nr:hypothetical protein FRX31_026007 [Thalictrum thalictroides]